MDPKQQLNQLDPKLKEAYERVMGTPLAGTPPAQGQAPTQPTAPAPVTAPVPQPPLAQPSMPPQQQVPAGTMPTAPMQPNPPTTQAMPPQMPHQPPMQTPMAPQVPAAPTSAANPFSAPMAHPAAENPKPGPASHGFVAGKRGLKISPVILITGGIIFLGVYTVFWLKFFNIPIPFLGQ